MQLITLYTVKNEVFSRLSHICKLHLWHAKEAADVHPGGTTEHTPSILGGHLKEKCFKVVAIEEGQSADWCVPVFPLQDGSVKMHCAG